MEENTSGTTTPPTRLQALRAWWVRPAVRWSVNGLCVLLILPLLIWLAAWAQRHDEPLRPEITRLLQVEPLLDDPDNAYFTLLGMTAPEGADAHRAGSVAVMAAFSRYTRTSSFNPGPAQGQSQADAPQSQSVSPTLPMGDVLPLTPIAPVCPEGIAVCLVPMRAQAAQARAWESAHAVVWKRYLAAAQKSRYVDMNLGADALAQRLTLFSDAARFIAVERWTRRQPQEALSILERSIGLCRAVLSGTVAPVTQRAAQRCVAYGWMLASALAQDATDAVFKRQNVNFQRLVSLLMPEEQAIAPLVRTALRESLPTLLDTAQAQSLTQPSNPWIKELLRPFYLQRATLNRHYERMMALAALDRASNLELAQHASKTTNDSFWNRLRSGNPIGLWLLDFVSVERAEPWVTQALELRTLEAQRRLYLLVLQCRAAGTLPRNPAACAASAPPALHNPFDGSAPQWNAQQRTLSLPVAVVPTLDFTPLVYVEATQP